MPRAIFRLNQGLIIRSNPDIAQRIGKTSAVMQGVDAGTRALIAELTDLQHDFLLHESGVHTLLDSTVFGECAPSDDARDNGVEVSIEMLLDVGASPDPFLRSARRDAL